LVLLTPTVQLHDSEKQLLVGQTPEHLDTKTLMKVWEGDTVLDGFGGGARFENLSVSLVVSHCDKDLGWIETFTKGHRIANVTVISKCGQQPKPLPKGATLIELPNVGRCDHTYAYWMSRLMPELSNLEDIVFFLKDNSRTPAFPFKPRRFEDMVRIAWHAGMGCFQKPYPFRNNSQNVVSAYYLPKILDRFSMQRYLPKKNNNTVFKSSFENLGAWRKAMGIESPDPLTRVCFGGNFAVKTSKILDVGAAVLDRMERSLSRADNLEEGHFCERIWGTLLADRLSVKLSQRLLSLTGGPDCATGMIQWGGLLLPNSTLKRFPCL